MSPLLYIGFVLLILKAIRMMLTKWRGTVDKSNEISVSGKIVVITGASNGIGKATALEMAVRNANVILACRNKEKANDTVAYIRRKTKSGQLVIHFVY